MAHVVPGPAGPPPLGPDGFDWTAWHADPVVVGGLVVLGAAYAAATLWRNRLAPGARVEPAKALCFAGALGVLFVALTGPLHDLSDYYLFSAHMVQHMLLVFALPPLLLHGTPGWMVRPMLRDPRLLQLGRVLTRPAAAFAVFNVILVAWHLPPVYNLAMDQHQVHIVGHLLMIAGSVILWWPVLSPVRELPRAPYPVQLLYLFVVGLPMVMVAIFISMADGLLYPYYAASPRIWAQLTPRADQHLGGLIMWIPGGLVFLIAISVIFFRWQGAGGDDVAVRGEAEGEPSEYKRALPSAVEAEPTAGRGAAEAEPTAYKKGVPG
jgi:putative membrane protein